MTFRARYRLYMRIRVYEGSVLQASYTGTSSSSYTITVGGGSVDSTVYITYYDTLSFRPFVLWTYSSAVPFDGAALALNQSIAELDAPTPLPLLTGQQQYGVGGFLPVVSGSRPSTPLLLRTPQMPQGPERLS